MNVKRQGPACTFFIGRLYAFAGYYDGNFYNSIEILDINANKDAWQLIELEQILPRQYPIICPISDSELVISGGFYRKPDGTNALYHDVYIFSTDQQQVVRKISEDTGLYFRAQSAPISLAKDTFVALL